MEKTRCITSFAEKAYKAGFTSALRAISPTHRYHSSCVNLENVNPQTRLAHYLAFSLLGLTAIALYEQVRKNFPKLKLPTTTSLAIMLSEDSDSDTDPSPPDPIPVPVEY